MAVLSKAAVLFAEQGLEQSPHSNASSHHRSNSAFTGAKIKFTGVLSGCLFYVIIILQVTDRFQVPGQSCLRIIEKR